MVAGGNEQRDLRSGETSLYAEAWLRRRRFTPSPGTGPGQDHTGLYKGSGYYMYFEASSPNWPLVTSSLVRAKKLLFVCIFLAYDCSTTCTSNPFSVLARIFVLVQITCDDLDPSLEHLYIHFSPLGKPSSAI